MKLDEYTTNLLALIRRGIFTPQQATDQLVKHYGEEHAKMIIKEINQAADEAQYNAPHMEKPQSPDLVVSSDGYILNSAAAPTKKRTLQDELQGR